MRRFDPTALITQPRYRIGCSVLIGIIATIIGHRSHTARGLLGADFTWVWYGARALLDGQNPYDNPLFAYGNPYPFDQPLLYPLPAVLLAIPFLALPVGHAASVFVGLSSAVLAFVMTRDGPHRLGLFLSAPFFVAVALAQWSPLLMISLFVPALLPLTVAKPNLAIPLVLNRPSIRVLVASGAFIAVSLVVLPSWPFDWLRNTMQQHGHGPPLVTLPGPLLVLAALYWRRPKARFFLLMSVVPQLLFFADQLLLWWLARSLRQTLLMSLMSWVGLFGWVVTIPGGLTSDTSVWGAAPWVVSFVYLPALAVLLWNERTRKPTDKITEPVPASPDHAHA